jgi:hypothetical protein
MLVSEATWLAFAVFSGLRTISYVLQIVRSPRTTAARRRYRVRRGFCGRARMLPPACTLR